jgi:hypothetical protein
LHWVGDRPDIQKQSELEDFIFNPEWVKGPAYAVIHAAHGNDGKLSATDFSQVLGERGIEARIDQRRVINLMAACELCFRSTDSGGGSGYLVVDAIPALPRGMEIPQPRVLRKEKASFSWEFTFLPDHLLVQLLGRWFHRREQEVQYFRNEIGLLSADRKCLARLSAEPGKHRLRIRFFTKNGGSWNELQSEIRSEIEKILLGHVRGEESLWEEKSEAALDRSELNQVEQELVADTLEAIQQNAIVQQYELSGQDMSEVQKQLTYMLEWSKRELTAAECAAFRSCLLFQVYELKRGIGSDDDFPFKSQRRFIDPANSEVATGVGPWLQRRSCFAQIQVLSRRSIQPERKRNSARFAKRMPPLYLSGSLPAGSVVNRLEMSSEVLELVQGSSEFRRRPDALRPLIPRIVDVGGSQAG